MSMRNVNVSLACWTTTVFAVALAAVLLSGCDNTVTTAGIDGSGGPVYAQGPIQAFGSIVVGGDHYDIASAVIMVNGQPASADDLALGQVVAVQGQIAADGSRVAETVEFDANLRGPVQSIDSANGVIIAMGQQIRVGSATTIVAGSGDTLDDLAVDDYVEVSGLVDTSGDLVATRIEQVNPSGEIYIVGIASAVDTAAFTFSIGNLVVDYSSVGLIEDFPGGGPSNGDLVRAVGSGLDSTGALTATRLSLVQDEDSESDGEAAEIEGLITRFVSETDFDVSGRPATTTSDTVYEGGSSADLQLNVKVQVEGQFDASNTIVASKIEVKDGGAVQ